MKTIYLAIALAPLAGALIAGLFGRAIGRAGAHWVTNIGVAVSAILSLYAYKVMMFDGGAVFNETIYTWLTTGSLSLEIGFLVDRLTVTFRHDFSDMVSVRNLTRWQRVDQYSQTSAPQGTSAAHRPTSRSG